MRCNARCNDVDGGVGVPCNTRVLRVFCGISLGRFDRCATRLHAPGIATVSRGNPAGTNRPGGFAPLALTYLCVLLLSSFTWSKKTKVLKQADILIMYIVHKSVGEKSDQVPSNSAVIIEY